MGTCVAANIAHRNMRSFSDRNISIPPSAKNDPNLAHATHPHRKLVTNCSPKRKGIR